MIFATSDATQGLFMSVMALLVTLYVLCILVPINAGTLCMVGVAYSYNVEDNNSHFLGRSSRDREFERARASALECPS